MKQTKIKDNKKPKSKGICGINVFKNCEENRKNSYIEKMAKAISCNEDYVKYVPGKKFV